MAPVRRFGSAAASEIGSQNDPGVRSKAIDALTRAALAADMLDDPRTAASALDVSIQKQVLNLLTNLQKKYKLSYLFITQDLAVMRAMAHRVRVMKEGRVVEAGDTPAGRAGCAVASVHAIVARVVDAGGAAQPAGERG